jgi:hypothetical protein
MGECTFEDAREVVAVQKTYTQRVAGNGGLDAGADKQQESITALRAEEDKERRVGLLALRREFRVRCTCGTKTY